MTDDDFQGFIDPPSPFARLEEWERFERDTLRTMNPDWPTTKRLREELNRRREKEPWFQEMYARDRARRDDTNAGLPPRPATTRPEHRGSRSAGAAPEPAQDGHGREPMTRRSRQPSEAERMRPEELTSLRREMEEAATLLREAFRKDPALRPDEDR